MSLDIHLNDGWCEHCKRGSEVFWQNILDGWAPPVIEVAGVEPMRPSMEKAQREMGIAEAVLGRKP